MYLFFLLFSFYACGCGIYRIAWRSAVSVPSRSSTAYYALQASLTTRSASRASSATCAWTAFLSRSMPPIASTASMTSTSKQLYPVTFLVLVKNSFLSVLSDYYRKFAPRCSVCHDPIMPEPGQEETVRVVALDRSFHVQCYKCEVFDFYLECFVLNYMISIFYLFSIKIKQDCEMVLSSEAEGRGCYPLDGRVLCKSCNAIRVNALTNTSTEL